METAVCHAVTLLSFYLHLLLFIIELLIWFKSIGFYYTITAGALEYLH